MNYELVIPVLIAFLISVVLSPIIIPFLQKLKFGQYIRTEGPASHQKKAGTPTMGGIIILIGIVITSLLYIKDYPKMIPILFSTVGFGLIGFLDDYIKVVMKRNLGLKAWQKMVGQILVTAVFGYYVVNMTDIGREILIPFTNGQYVDVGNLYLPLLFVAMLGTVNGVNFTDGLDGLASSVTCLLYTSTVCYRTYARGFKSVFWAGYRRSEDSD